MNEPPLPERAGWAPALKGDVYTAEQMRAYARPLLERIKDLEADRARVDHLERTKDFTLSRANRFVDPLVSKARVFTLLTQHITTNTVREALDAAIEKAKELS